VARRAYAGFLLSRSRIGGSCIAHRKRNKEKRDGESRRVSRANVRKNHFE